jgi:hypothetical protein
MTGNVIRKGPEKGLFLLINQNDLYAVLEPIRHVFSDGVKLYSIKLKSVKEDAILISKRG